MTWRLGWLCQRLGRELLADIPWSWLSNGWFCSHNEWASIQMGVSQVKLLHLFSKRGAKGSQYLCAMSFFFFRNKLVI